MKLKAWVSGSNGMTDVYVTIEVATKALRRSNRSPTALRGSCRRRSDRLACNRPRRRTS